MRRRQIRRAGVAAPLLLMLAATPAAAFEVNGGCSVTLTSMDAEGGVIDTAAGPGEGGTRDDPFMIDWDGSISWESDSGGTAFMNHSWQTFVFMIPTPVRGGDPNEDGGTTGEGTVGVAENAPFRTTGLYHVSGQIDGDEGAHCDGNGWFKLIGDPLGTIPFFVALVSILGGTALLFAARPSWR